MPRRLPRKVLRLSAALRPWQRAAIMAAIDIGLTPVALLIALSLRPDRAAPATADSATAALVTAVALARRRDTESETR